MKPYVSKELRTIILQESNWEFEAERTKENHALILSIVNHMGHPSRWGDFWSGTRILHLHPCDIDSGLINMPAVYVMTSAIKILYVGQTENFYGRLTNHGNKQPLLMQQDPMVHFICCNALSAD